MGALVTDRHSQVAKWVRETLPETRHYYDVWHLAKGNYTKVYHALMLYNSLCKKLEKLVRQKHCKIIGLWDQKYLQPHIMVCSINP